MVRTLLLRILLKLDLTGLNEWFTDGIEEDNWNITYHDYDPEKEKTQGSITDSWKWIFWNTWCNGRNRSQRK